jgi:hypothetical protein
LGFGPDRVNAMNAPAHVSTYLDTLRERVLVDIGQARHNGEFRPDNAAWAILALAASGKPFDILEPARTRLVKSQHEDGSVSISPDHPEAFWPTPLAILAWHGSSRHRESLDRAIQFLVKTTGRHFAKESGSPLAHDPSLLGWPWIAGTHSMVEPTALGVLALRVTGHGDHARVREAVHMLLDRQLSRGGWNYGNTMVYGQELYPQPENTGLALAALEGIVPLEKVRHSLDYLGKRVEKIRTPLSLGWAVLGLGAWGQRPRKARLWLAECLERQNRYGSFDTSNLSLLLISFMASRGLVGIFARK